MPEAFLEAEDLRSEIQRARPRWMVPAPNLRYWWKLRSDWQQGTWRRARSRTGWMASTIDERMPDDLGRARSQATASRARARELGQTIATLNLDQATAWYLEKVPGWDGQKFEAWRAEGEARWWKDLIVAASPAMVEWLGPWLDLGYIRTHRSEWVTFWTREVQRERLPREWIRWARTELRALKKVTPGTPVDNQIATYLPDFDTFVTADRGFVQCVEALRLCSLGTGLNNRRTCRGCSGRRPPQSHSPKRVSAIVSGRSRRAGRSGLGLTFDHRPF